LIRALRMVASSLVETLARWLVGVTAAVKIFARF
jgi:hypothetical protein